MRQSFTLIEIIFVLIVIGMLAVIALPKFTMVLEQATISKVQSTVTAIRSGIQIQKNKNILMGLAPYPTSLETGSGLFGAVLPDPIIPKTQNGWQKVGPTRYQYSFNGNVLYFDYNISTGKFTCDNVHSTSGLCNYF